MGFINAMPGAIAQGLIWGLFAIGLYISYKILDIADLTVDGSICTGACVLAVLMSKGVNVYLCILAAFLAGATAVSVGTANFVDPCTTIKVVEGIESYMRKYGVKDIKELVGAVHDR